MKNRGKNKSVAFKILVSVYIYIYIYTYSTDTIQVSDISEYNYHQPGSSMSLPHLELCMAPGQVSENDAICHHQTWQG